MSKSFNPTCGLRQGSVISPFINIYMEELSILLNKASIGCHINNIFINHLIYADDLVIFLPSTNGLKNLLNVWSGFGIRFDVIFNVIKSKCIIFNICKQKFTNPPFFLSGKPLEMVKTIKYLVIIISDLSDDKEVTY